MTFSGSNPANSANSSKVFGGPSKGSSVLVVVSVCGYVFVDLVDYDIGFIVEEGLFCGLGIRVASHPASSEPSKQSGSPSQTHCLSTHLSSQWCSCIPQFSTDFGPSNVFKVIL